MKNPSALFRWAALVLFVSGSVSCMTTYDSAGRPVQSVDPAAAVAGAAAAGLIGYAIANNKDDHHHHHHRPPPPRGYYGRPYHRGPYRY
jgi:hypothetical protein